MINLRKAWAERKQEKPARSRKNGVLITEIGKKDGVILDTLHKRIPERSKKEGIITATLHARAKEDAVKYKKRLRA